MPVADVAAQVQGHLLTEVAQAVAQKVWEGMVVRHGRPGSQQCAKDARSCLICVFGIIRVSVHHNKMCIEIECKQTEKVAAKGPNKFKNESLPVVTD